MTAAMTSAATLRGQADDFEWFNAWWDQARSVAPRVVVPAVALSPSVAKLQSAGQKLAASTRAALIARDVAEIEVVRDRLFAGMGGTYMRVKGSDAPRMAKSTGPIVIATVLGGFIVAISSAAAAFMKFAR
jgi:hypothetical protein